jgi:hypothetical protein
MAPGELMVLHEGTMHRPTVILVARRWRPRAQAAGALLAGVLSGGPAGADDASAAAQFDYGVAEMMAGRYPTGCAALAGSFRLDPRPGTLFTLAECDLKWGHTASALAGYEEYLALYSRMSPDQKAKQSERARVAEGERRELEATVPRLSVQLPSGAPEGVRVERDDVVLGGPMLGAAMPVDPGEHVVRVTTADGRTREERVRLEAGGARVVVAALPLAEPSETAAPVPAAAPSPQAPASHRTFMFIAIGVAGAGAVVAAVTGGLALSKKSTAASDCDADGACSSAAGVDAGNTAKGLANAETVAIVAGGVALATAIVLAMTEPKGGGVTMSVGLRGAGAWIGGTY